MNTIKRMRKPESFTESRPWADRSRKAKQPRVKDKDLKRLLEFDDVLGLDHHDPRLGASHGSTFIEDEDNSSSVTSFSTNATMDDNPGAGLTIDKYFYQPLGRAIEKFALKIAMRLNICHPSPAQILRVIGLVPMNRYWSSEVKKPSDVVNRISTVSPRELPGILSLVQQSL